MTGKMVQDYRAEEYSVLSGPGRKEPSLPKREYLGRVLGRLAGIRGKKHR
jgi:hypothetical protein